MRVLVAWVAMLSLGMLGSASAQQPGGRVTGIVFDSTVMAPLSEARVAVLGTSASTFTDGAGRFELDGVPSGAHFVSFFHPRLQELGVSAKGREVTFAQGRTERVELAVPSELTLLGAWCLAESEGTGFAPVAGIVHDTLTGVPLPRATVTIRQFDAESGASAGPSLTTKTDESGYYRFCNAPVGRTLVVQPQFGMSTGEPSRFVLASNRGRVENLRMVLSSVGQLQGQVTDYATGEPVAGASVELVGSGLSQITDENGRFMLDSIPPGKQVVRTGYLGYAERTDSVTVFSNQAVRVEVRLTTEAIAIEGMVVTARGRLGEAFVDAGRRTDFIGLSDIEPMLPRLRNMEDLLRNARFPSLSIREIARENAVGGVQRVLCIESIRLARGNDCRMVAVYMNGTRLPDPAQFLNTLPPGMIESVQYLSPLEASIRYGADAAAGVLVITTRSGG